MSRKRVFVLAIVVVVLAALPARAASFQGLGDLPTGRFGSGAWDVSADGSVVVGGGTSVYRNCEAFRWTDANGMVGLGWLPGDDESLAFGVSANGSVVVGYSYAESDSILEAFRWTDANGMVGLGFLPGALWFLSMAFGVSADGSVLVGYSSSPLGAEAFRWTEANGMLTLSNQPDGCIAQAAYGVSADGSVVVGLGYSESASGTEAFRWTDANGMVGLGDLPGGAFYSEAWAVSADGSVVVGDSNSASGREVFRWTQATGMVGLGDLAGGQFRSQAGAVSADGAVVVGRSVTGGTSDRPDWEAFIWDPSNGIQNLKEVLENAYGLDLSGWTLTSASGISADGSTIVGGATNPDGHNEAWIAVIDRPSPSVTLTINVEPNNIDVNTITPGVGEHTYYWSWPVVLNAEPFLKCPYVYRFDHWVGDVAAPNSSTTTIVMTEDKTVTVMFFADERRCGDECHPILQGDINEDCYVNFDDFALYCEEWLACTHPDCD